MYENDEITSLTFMWDHNLIENFKRLLIDKSSRTVIS